MVTEQTPRERVAAHIRRLERTAADLVQVLDAAARELDDNGSPYLERAGWSRAELAPISERLRTTEQRLERLAMRAEMVHELPPVGPAEQLDIEALEEVA